LFVDQYNKLREKLDELTSFDDNTMATGLLFGTNEALQIESRLTRVLTDRFYGVGSIQSLEQLGISLDQEGRLELDESKLQDAFADDPDAVQQFFMDEDFGFAAQLDAVVESLAGEGNSLLLSRNEVLQRRIDEYADKIEFYNERLESERERLLKYYYNTELAISKIQSNLSAIQSLSPLPPMTASVSSNSAT
jgi:flagellar hook-associated protein 2